MKKSPQKIIVAIGRKTSLTLKLRWKKLPKTKFVVEILYIDELSVVQYNFIYFLMF